MPSLATAEMAEGVGNAPTSADADPVFETGAASFYLPAFQKWSGWWDSHPRPPPSEGGRLLLTLHPGTLVLAERIPRSSSALEALRSGD